MKKLFWTLCAIVWGLSALLEILTILGLGNFHMGPGTAFGACVGATLYSLVVRSE